MDVMGIKELGQKRLSSTLRWRESDEYKQICAVHKKQCEMLVRIGEEFLKDIYDLDQNLKTIVTKIEYASGSDLHRGVYCPSPIWDLVVGKIHRGRILKRVTAASKISHCYGYNAGNNLLYCKALCDGEESNTEYLYTEGCSRYGITVNSNYELDAISEEIFEGEKLQKYSYVEVYPDENGYFCSNLHVERYIYDEIGLKSCDQEDFQPYVNVLSAYHYDFERVDGYFSSYSAMESPYNEDIFSSIALPKYTVGIKRKA